MSVFASVDVSNVVPGTGATNLGKPEDGAHTTGDTGVLILPVRTDSPTATFGADNDYTPATCNSNGNLKVQVQSSLEETFMCTTGLITPAASTSDFWEIYYNSRLVKILKIGLIYIAATPSGSFNFFLIKRSAANSSGTSNTETSIALDSANSGSNLPVIKSYTGNPTLGAAVGTLAHASLVAIDSDLTTVSSGIDAEHVVFDATTGTMQPIVLRASGEGLVLNANGVTVGGTTPKVSVNVLYKAA